MRRLVTIFVVSAAAALAGAAGAVVVGSTPPEPPDPAQAGPPDTTQAISLQQPSDPGDGGVHGGPIERFHDAAECGLVDVLALPGNWTHGDYVSAVAALGDPSMVPVAARSACGKPTVSLQGGPPGHAGADVTWVPPGLVKRAQGGGPPHSQGGGPPPHAQGKAWGRTGAASGN